MAVTPTKANDFTALVASVKVAVVAPAAMVTLAGTVADELVLLRVTTTPPAGAGEASWTVPPVEVPPFRMRLFNHIVFNNSGVTERLELTFDEL
jgi:hypothetical protein